ncbi:unnamed protein product [Soboliphyme baturini]|uniref:Protein kinase domain-containing protein n=1 Tax=Soboliphyme baturini TaxID=241478 RepID=A0A183JAT4_9BILA|nr:unnamed protein product [Soboliphyme baturini]
MARFFSGSFPSEALLIKEGDILEGRWVVGIILGSGNFGAVYEVRDKHTNLRRALKIGSKTGGYMSLETETYILKALSKKQKKHTCEYVTSGKFRDLRYLIMSIAGRNLADLKRAVLEHRFSLNTTVRLGIQCIEAIKEIHEIGFVHRDIKPTNFAIGISGEDARNVYILDFGLARRYRAKDSQLVPARKRVTFRGTVRYASVNAHHHRDLGPCDDLWSMLYMLIEFRLCRLPWQHMNNEKDVGELKDHMKAKELLRDLPAEFYLIYHALVYMKYEDTPDYEWFIDKLKGVMKARGYNQQSPYDWEEGGDSYRHTLKVPIPEYPYASQIAAAEDVQRDSSSNSE